MEIQRLNVLLQPTIRAEQPESASGTSAAGGTPSFGQVLAEAIQRVEQQQIQAEDAAVRLAAGQVEDLAEVMITAEKANLSLGLAVQIRNKALEAYQEIMRMQL